MEVLNISVLEYLIFLPLYTYKLEEICSFSVSLMITNNVVP
jgi:hypothetical protein